MTSASTTSTATRQYTDDQYIAGLKGNCQTVTKAFFYDLCQYTLNDIRFSLFKGSVDYDEMVSELYLYLSERQWHRLDTFAGVNGCSLRTWMTRLAWRYFMAKRDMLLCDEAPLPDQHSPSQLVDTLTHADIAMDVENTLRRMPNQRYAQVLRLLLLMEYPVERVAEMLDTSTANIYNIKHRATLQFVKTYAM